MGMKIDRKCTRCRRDDSIPAESVEHALALEKAAKAQAANAQILKETVEKMAPAERPALFVVLGEKVIMHDHLCSDPDAKRSCAKRVTDLVVAMEELDERKPRTKKEKKEEKAEDAK